MAKRATLASQAYREILATEPVLAEKVTEALLRLKAATATLSTVPATAYMASRGIAAIRRIPRRPGENNATPNVRAKPPPKAVGLSALLGHWSKKKRERPVMQPELTHEALRLYEQNQALHR